MPALFTIRLTYWAKKGLDHVSCRVDIYRARQMIAAGESVLELTIGEHDIRTSPDILKAMNVSAVGGHTGYASVPGTVALRQTVAKRIADRTGVPTTQDNILITPGGQAALFASHHAKGDPCAP